MRRFSWSLALVAAVVVVGCHPMQVKKGGEAAGKSAAAKPVRDDRLDTRDLEKKKQQAKIRASKQLMINALDGVLSDLESQGIKVKKTPAKKPWRLIDPALQQVSDPVAKHQQAVALADRFAKRIGAIMNRSIDVAVYDSDKETLQLN
jgi:hypothetical protein